jgi:hypothetical protein
MATFTSALITYVSVDADTSVPTIPVSPTSASGASN